MRAPSRLVIATKNSDKVREVRAVLARSIPTTTVVEGLEWDDVDETGSTLIENALLKAMAVVAATGIPALADDTGLEVDALDGGPGVHTARFAGPGASYEANRQKLISVLTDTDNRSARFRTVVAMAFPDGTAVTAEGVLEGEITRGERGSGGFGYDPVFSVGGRTLAEIPEREKNTMSHRAVALAALVERLNNPTTD
ncbi:RdgB/HAM1 family non-canonical purine NTP pyrophosphatase [bacterium]|nr:RdgB/HAM1 family non-canonical purine NTP pyrophosphatase [bacterium]